MSIEYMNMVSKDTLPETWVKFTLLIAEVKMYGNRRTLNQANSFVQHLLQIPISSRPDHWRPSALK